ncbi:VOC family protein [Pseudonocardia nematodicida]|uniref:VOC family protein n=1 Tax=Pseudonocardia nematodicida TaxID=1206997 RepID=A0ABV1KH44_9PSEU
MTTQPQHEIVGVLAGLATSDMDRGIDWLTMVLGREPTARPMPILADWALGAAGTLQLVHDAERAGGSMVTLQVADLAAVAERLADRGLEFPYDETTSQRVKFAQLTDPDGNSVTLVEAK